MNINLSFKDTIYHVIHTFLFLETDKRAFKQTKFAKKAPRGMYDQYVNYSLILHV